MNSQSSEKKYRAVGQLPQCDGTEHHPVDAPPAPNTPSVVACHLPTRWADFTLHGFADPATGREHVALTLGDFTDGAPVLLRLHSECLTGDTLFSLRCDCGPQLEASLRAIAAEGRGALVYLRQEGRGIGLINKIRAYALQDSGADTVDANRMLGFADDARNYGFAADIVRALGIHRARLLTNNPLKVRALEALDIAVVERIPLHAGANPLNHRYLATKAHRMGHIQD
ncbi:MAG: GTP cyclohydrolase II [Gammaproteobacteria bacterium]|nr:GTP cyclohydrolase II [Gammaproteobacteria bacterium]MBU0772737.1 GTP cyclohydrolase II [Gammaproteobacteria bacterium]MBU0855665.1 GTP cyclohydrolase II [Gammaproteobacteria bacterium]MBU1847066.1 GTP cyclohydrolase II [Gammaproteobacteria bacterium]